MHGWIVPPPKKPTKSRDALRREREEKVRGLLRHGLLRSERITKIGGRLIAPVAEHGRQNLTLLEKQEHAISMKVICEVLYVPLRGQYGR
jgi:Protein-L-isoaspartate(D-aspartate) O-methyltransferase (PCMT)